MLLPHDQAFSLHVIYRDFVLKVNKKIKGSRACMYSSVLSKILSRTKKSMLMFKSIFDVQLLKLKL